MKKLHVISFILIIVGALNWGLIGFFDWNLVSSIFGSGGLERTIYALVGIAAIIELIGMKKCCKGKGDSSPAPEQAPSNPEM